MGKKITDGQTSFEELEVYFFLNNLPIYDNRISIKELAEPQYVKKFCKIKILVHVHLLFIIGLLDQPDSDFENILNKFFLKTFFRNISLTTEAQPMWLQVARSITSLCWTIMSKYRHRRCSNTSLCGTMCIQLHPATVLWTCIKTEFVTSTYHNEL